MRLRVRVCKFFCDEPSCERKIFAERLENIAGVHARGTDRRREALEWIAFAIGGEAGARPARELGLLVSPDTLLNRVRGAFLAEAEDVRVLGVDDFGFRKGNAPGTILVNVERHKVVDLFEGHSVESIARWLGRHRGVEVVTRDRAHVCREGINAGAPDALQVADRWHLLRSLALALEEFLLRKRIALGRAVAQETADGKEALPGSVDVDVSTLSARLGRPYGSIEGPARKCHERLVERWEEMLNAEQKAYLGRLCDSDAALADARHLTQEFAGMVRNLEGEKLNGWLAEAAGCEAQVMRKFAAGLTKDLPAVRAGLTEEWSNGPT